MIEFNSASTFIANVKAALLFASTDPARSHMNVVRIETWGGAARVIATNGHALWISEIACRGGEACNLSIVREDIERVAKNLSKKGGHILLHRGETSGLWTVGQDDLRFSVKEESAAFPPYAQIIPVERNPKKTSSAVAVSAEYLANACQAFSLVASCEKIKKDRLLTGIELQFGGAEDQIVMLSEQAPKALLVLMPRRIRELGNTQLAAKYASTSDSLDQRLTTP